MTSHLPAKPNRSMAQLRGLQMAWAVCGALALVAGPAHALFGDDEARRAILDLRAKVDAHKQANDDALKRMADDARQLSEAVRAQIDEGQGPARRGLLELANQLESLRGELAGLRGQKETLARELAEMQRQQKDVLAVFDERLRALEPSKVTLDGREFLVKTDEKAAFEAAMSLLRDSKFPQAAAKFEELLQRFPGTGYAAQAYYWQGNAFYAARDYKPAIASYNQLLQDMPKHPRAPEAKLAIANCQLELKDAKAAKVTLQELAKAYPDSEAGAAARERLAKLK